MARFLTIVHFIIYFTQGTYGQFDESNLIDYLDIKVKIDSLENVAKKEYSQILDEYEKISDNSLFSRKDFLHQSLYYASFGKCVQSRKALLNCINLAPRLQNINDSIAVKNSNLYQVLEKCGLLNIFCDSLISKTIRFNKLKLAENSSERTFYKQLRKNDQFMRSNDTSLKALITEDNWEVLEKDFFGIQNKLDSINRQKLEKYSQGLKKINFTLLSEEIKYTIFLIGQHSDYDLGFQRKVLNLMYNQVHSGNIKWMNLAYIIDRYLLNTKGYQIFGSQFTFIDDQMVPKTLKYPNRVDQYRKIAGLPPLSNYLRDSENFLNLKK